MLKVFAHCWLILSLLVVPVQFAAADMAVLDHAQGKCAMMDMADHDMAGMDHDMSAMDKGNCDCPDQCKTSCAGAHVSLAMPGSVQIAHTITLTGIDSLSEAARGIDLATEKRPPRTLHA